MSPLPPQCLPLADGDPRAVGPYLILGLLGAGSMGKVYLAHRDDGKNVAIKIVRPELARDRVFLRRFKDEAENASRVDDTYTAKVIEAVVDSANPYLVTEFIEGPTLDELISEQGPLEPSAAKAVCVGTAAALIAIHDAAVVHRDLKPSNVMLSNFGARVIDFGIARSLSAATRLTRAGMPVGTPAYMSPEQMQDEVITPASDVFSWAGVMVYAATGHQPFGSEDANLIVVFRQVIEGEPRIDDMPDGLREIVADALRKDPKARPTARQLLARLTGGPIMGDPSALAERVIDNDAIRAAVSAAQEDPPVESIQETAISRLWDMVTEEPGRTGEQGSHRERLASFSPRMVAEGLSQLDPADAADAFQSLLGTGRVEGWLMEVLFGTSHEHHQEILLSLAPSELNRLAESLRRPALRSAGTAISASSQDKPPVYPQPPYEPPAYQSLSYPPAYHPPAYHPPAYLPPAYLPPEYQPYVTPLVRLLAAQHGIDLTKVAGTGVGGRIRKQDVLDAVRARSTGSVTP